jgi:hypothetical protein
VDSVLYTVHYYGSISDTADVINTADVVNTADVFTAERGFYHHPVVVARCGFLWVLSGSLCP